tara:strand:- start:71 stop:436 length:366 start_codon:yes stop_codon:yes gene_type:complete
MADLKTLHQISDNFYEPDQTGTISLKVIIEGNSMTLKYSTIVHFAEERSLQMQVQRANEQALQLIDSKIADLKSKYREQAGETLQVEDLGGKDHLELISATANSARKVAYYRYNRSYAISE